LREVGIRVIGGLVHHGSGPRYTQLLDDRAREAGAPEQVIHLIPGEEEATAAAMTLAQTGELVVITPSDISGCWKQTRNSSGCSRQATTAAMSSQRFENVRE
jgi:hypothetical protein